MVSKLLMNDVQCALNIHHSTFRLASIFSKQKMSRDEMSAVRRES